MTIAQHPFLARAPLWSYREAAEIFGLDAVHGRRTIRYLAEQHGITPKRTNNPKVKGLDRADMEVLARLLNTTIPWPDTSAAS